MHSNINRLFAKLDLFSNIFFVRSLCNAHFTLSFQEEEDIDDVESVQFPVSMVAGKQLVMNDSVRG